MSIEIRCNDPDFDPKRAVMINGFAYMPVTRAEIPADVRRLVIEMQEEFTERSDGIRELTAEELEVPPHFLETAGQIMRDAAATFRAYEAHHMEKGTIEGDGKARCNAKMAERIETYLKRPPGDVPVDVGRLVRAARKVSCESSALREMATLYFNPKRRLAELDELAEAASAFEDRVPFSIDEIPDVDQLPPEDEIADVANALRDLDHKELADQLDAVAKRIFAKGEQP